jgi:hypothetical protein
MEQDPPLERQRAHPTVLLLPGNPPKERLDGMIFKICPSMPASDIHYAGCENQMQAPAGRTINSIPMFVLDSKHPGDFASGNMNCVQT